MSFMQRCSARLKVLVLLELAIVLPAAALIIFSLWSLKSIERDRAVEAAIQRDFSYILKGLEKRLNEQGTNILARARKDFPCEDEAPVPVLNAMLEKSPQLSMAFLFDERDGKVIVVGAPERLSRDEAFRKEVEYFAKSVAWLKMEGKGMVKKLWEMEEKGEPPYFAYPHWTEHLPDKEYVPMAFFTLPNASRHRVVIGGVLFSDPYLVSELFPSVIEEVISEDVPVKGGKGAQHSAAVISIRARGEKRYMAASPGWDGGKPEVEKATEGIFPGLLLQMKLRGTTVAALGQRFIHQPVGDRNPFLLAGRGRVSHLPQRLPGDATGQAEVRLRG
jgi:hypothetical protein